MTYSVILPNLLLGPALTPDVHAMLLEQVLPAIVCVAPQNEVPDYVTPLPTYRFPVSFMLPDDVSKQNIHAAVTKCIELIASGHTVYLHCWQGVNRSAAVAVVVVEKVMHISRAEAMAYVSMCRPAVDPKKHLAAFF